MIEQLNLGIIHRKSVAHTRQSEVAECGLACLAMIAGYHGLSVDIALLRRQFPPSVRGTTLRSLMIDADRIGLSPRAVRVELQDLSAVALPAILHWNLSHFVVLEKINKKHAFILDPAGMARWIPLREVSKHFTGVALELTPSAEFEAGDYRHKVKLSSLWGRLKGFKRTIGQATILSLVIQMFAVASPFYLQIAIDTALPQSDINLLSSAALCFIVFAVLNGLASLVRSSVLLSAGSSFGYGLSSNVARKLFRLPTDWFGKRPVGDILSRFQSVLPIRKMLSEDAPVTVVDSALALITIVCMTIFSGILTFLALLSVVLFGLCRIILFSRQKLAQEDVLVSSAREQSFLIESVQGMRALRLASRETFRHAAWQSRMTDAVNGSVRLQRLLNWQSMLQSTIFSIENVISIWFAVTMVVQGKLTLGMIFAFFAYKAQFISASSSLISKTADFRMLNLHLDRLSDIVLNDDDVSFRFDNAPNKTFQGDIELRNVFFQYGKDDSPVLKGVNLHVKAGESVAITGPSGGGKSTLLMILLGLSEPNQGNVLVDGVPLNVFGHKCFHSQVGAVLQDDVLFSGSVSDNISLFDENPDHEKVKNCAKVASIFEDIQRMPMKFETFVGELGAALSGGQRQRILLARALYRSPRLLVMDEGTSHLDEARERDVNAAISKMGITRIIVAHRKETIATAERVFTLSDGIVLERHS